MSNISSQPSTNADPAPAADALAGLYHMSNTAGAGTQEYVAINPTSVAAAVLGFSGILAILTNVLLILPIAGVICSIIAFVQIRRSNGTQSGRILAALGLGFSLLVGGGIAGVQAVDAFHTSSDEIQIAQLVHDFGNDVIAGNFAAAYDRFTPDFKDRLTLTQFQATLKPVLMFEEVGKLTTVDWNKHRMEISDKPSDNGSITAYAMILFTYERGAQPKRIVFGAEKSNGVWKLSDVPELFPKKK